MNTRAAAGAVVALALSVAGCAGGGSAGGGRAVPPGVWYQPLEQQQQAPGQGRAVQAAARPEAYFDDACADYITDEALFLRCQWVTGPDMAQYVPVIGLDAPLADRMRCHPLRDDPPGYRACLGRPS